MIDWVLSVCLINMFLSNHIVVAVIHCCITVNYQLLIHVFYSSALLCKEYGAAYCYQCSVVWVHVYMFVVHLDQLC